MFLGKSGYIKHMIKKALIVDDEPDIREIIRFIMEEEGFEVIEASSGEEVLDLAEKEQPSIITLDIMLPGLDGFEIIKLLKDNPLTCSIPIIILSALSEKDISGKGIFRQAISDYLCKPFRPDELILSVRNILSLCQKDKDRKKKILITDDEADILDIISTHINESGYSSLVASDGIEAIEIVKKEKPDLIILDLKMPRMDGFSVIKQLKKDEATSSIPIIVLTGIFLSDEERSQIMQLGAAQFLTKPFNSQDLLKEIKNILCQENVF